MTFTLLGSGADPVTRNARRAARFKGKSATLSSEITLRPGRRVEYLDAIVVKSCTRVHAAMKNGMVRVFEQGKELTPESFMNRMRELLGDAAPAVETSAPASLEEEISGLSEGEQRGLREEFDSTDPTTLRDNAKIATRRGLPHIAHAFTSLAAHHEERLAAEAAAAQAETKVETRVETKAEEPKTEAPPAVVETLPAPAEPEAVPVIPEIPPAAEVVVDPVAEVLEAEPTPEPETVEAEPPTSGPSDRAAKLPVEWRARTKDQLVALATELAIPMPEKITKANMVMAVETWLSS